MHTHTLTQKPTGLAGMLTSQGLTLGQTTATASQAPGGLKLGTGLALGGTAGQTGLSNTQTAQSTGLKLGATGLGSIQPATATSQAGLKLGMGLPFGTSTATATTGLGGLGLQTGLTGLTGLPATLTTTAQSSFRGLGGVDPNAATGGTCTMYFCKKTGQLTANLCQCTLMYK